MVIKNRDRPVAKLVPYEAQTRAGFPDLKEFRQSLGKGKRRGLNPKKPPHMPSALVTRDGRGIPMRRLLTSSAIPLGLVLLLVSGALLSGCDGEDDARTDRWLEQGRDHYWRGEHAEAIDALEIFVGHRPDDPEGRLYLAKSYLSVGRHEESERQIEAAISEAPDDSRFSELLGIIHTARYTSRPYTETWQRDGEAAIAAFQRAIALDSLRPGPYYNLGIMYNYLDSTRLATEAFISALRADSTVAPAHKKLGIIYRNQGLRQEAISALEKAVHYAPDDAESYLNLGIAYRDIGDFDKAVASLERAAELNPIDHKIQYTLGNMYMRLGHREKGRRVVERAERMRQLLGKLHAEVTPPRYGAVSLGSAKDHYHMGVVHLMAGRLDEAIAELRRSAEIGPDRKDTHSALGMALLETGRADEAVVPLQRAVELDGEDPTAHMRLGWAYRELDRLPEALRSFEEASRLDTSLPEAFLNRAHIHFRRGDFRESVGLLRRAIDLRPTYARAHLNLGASYVRLAEFDSAAAAYERVTELQPENAAAHLYLSDVYGTLGRPDDSERIKERARELTHTGKAE